MNFEYSVLLPVRFDESVNYLSEAFYSIKAQTLPPKSIILVIDGCATAPLANFLTQLSDDPTVHIIHIPKSDNLGAVLNIGLQYIDTPFVMRMDSDDISLPQRAAVAKEIFDLSENTAVVGAQIEEFSDTSARRSSRRVPCRHDDIAKTARFRNPMNHVSVVFRYDAVKNAGGYPEIPGFEDYCLWIRLIQNGHELKNSEETTVYVRWVDAVRYRRGGLKYFKNTLLAQRYLLEHKTISRIQMILNIFVRFIGSVLITAGLRSAIYRKFLRVRASDCVPKEQNQPSNPH